MRFPLSMASALVVLAVSLAGFSAVVSAAEEKPLSPIQAQLQKMQAGESSGMKTISVPQPAPSKAEPKESLNDNAKALAEKAEAESRAPTRLQLIEEAYKKAAQPPRENPAEAKPAEAQTQPKKTDPVSAQVMFENMQNDKPRIPPRLIPVE
ncbi:MAG: hypothetical protein JWO78_1738 [Micavibrio sp.]|nr:hypothetical protein [Micavibrio sp.]